MGCRCSGILRRARDLARIVHKASSLFSLGRDGGRLLYGAPAPRPLADPESWRARGITLLHFPVLRSQWRGRMEPGCDAATPEEKLTETHRSVLKEVLK